MKIMLVSGGSGGHIYPCLELGKYCKSLNNEILFCGALNSLEEKICKDNKLQFKGINIKRKTIFSYIKNVFESRKIIKEFKPDAMILFGNYVSVSFALSAISLRIPIYLHEQNVIYGKANKFLGYFAKRIYLSLPINKDIHKKKSMLVGNPKGDISSIRGIKFETGPNVVIVMGSLGSTTINNMLKKFIALCDNNIDYHIVVGNKYYNNFILDLKQKHNIHIYPYLNDLLAYIKSCDVFVSRAGATTISEILVNGVASILIPSPYVKNNHQYKNAKYLLDNKACVLIEEKDISAERLNEEINSLINNYNEIIKLRMNAKKLGLVKSKEKIYKDMEKSYER